MFPSSPICIRLSIDAFTLTVSPVIFFGSIVGNLKFDVLVIIEILAVSVVSPKRQFLPVFVLGDGFPDRLIKIFQQLSGPQHFAHSYFDNQVRPALQQPIDEPRNEDREDGRPDQSQSA